MRFGSVCSGIEAASVAWHPLGWKAAWLAEIEPFPCALLAHHYPEVPNLGDMTTIARRVLSGETEAPEVLTGGTPCQAFSVAGLRESLADQRGNLTLKFVELADAIDHVRVRRGDDPCIVVWENVPGVLSTKDNAFGCFLAGLAGEDEPLQPPGGRWADAGAVYGPARAIAWRTLDAQYFGLAQRRRRVFVVASARDGFDPATVLFEWQGVRRDSAPSREAGQRAARPIAAGSPGGSGYRNDADTADNLIAGTLGCRSADHPSGLKSESDFVVPVAFGGNNTAGPIDVATACNAHGGAGRMDFESETFIAFDCKASGQNGFGIGEIASTQRAMGHAGSHTNGGGHQAVMAGMQVRRLTPRECERLQGFPDDYTLVPFGRPSKAKLDADFLKYQMRGNPKHLGRDDIGRLAADGPRYKALGNSWAVPVARWIGGRIQQELETACKP